jgi:multiple sugar transport system substrate-binding protein
MKQKPGQTEWLYAPTHLLFVSILLLLYLAACQAQTFIPPRLETITAVTETGPQEAADPLYLPAPTATVDPVQRGQAGEAGILQAPTLNVWINETSPEHKELLQGMMDDFTLQSDIDVALQLVSPMLLPDLMQTAVLSDTLPDVVLHPLEYTMTWNEEGILDSQAASTIIDEIGRDSFDSAALELVGKDGQPVAIPSDGYQQIWLYRADWLEEEGLDVPDNYDDMILAAETFFDPDSIISGLVIPTESNLINTHRAFEHLAVANGCQLVDSKGEVHLLDSSCRDALDYYYSVVNQYSPPGVQTDTSARNAYLNGRTGIIMTSPNILPDLVEAGRLDQKSGIMTTLTGSGPAANAASFGNITVIGITPAADLETASAFANYWFNEGYPIWLAEETARKVPMRFGTNEEPRLFIDNWGRTPILGEENLVDLYGEQTVSLLRDGVADTERWGFREEQGALVGKLYENLTLSVVLQEMLSGYFNTAKTIQEAANRVIELIPNYQFPVEPTPEPTPET